MSVVNTEKKAVFRQMCNCALLSGSHFADKCAQEAKRKEWAQRASAKKQKQLERDEKNAARQQEWQARQEKREQDPEWQRRHAAYLRYQAKRDAEAKAQADREAAEAKAAAQWEADQRLKAQRKAHQQMLAKLEADRQKAQQDAADEQKAQQEAADEQKAKLGKGKGNGPPKAADEQSAQADLDDWAAPQPGPFLKSWTDEPSDDASTVASETSHVPKVQPVAAAVHRGPVVRYFYKEEARRLQKVKAALAELYWLQKQVDAGKKCELDRSQFAKIHGKHAQKRLKELEESDVLKMERAGYQLRDKYY
jgi:hypothetical protein